jgi:heat shock protein HslJ
MKDLTTRKQMVIVGVLLLAAVVAACAPAAAPSGQDAVTPTGGENPLEGTEWVLTSLNGKALLEGTHISLSFDEGWISGFAGCNSYGGGPDSGNYVATEEGTWRMREIAITEMYCPSPEGVVEQEQAYVQALTEAATYRLSDDRLEMQNAAGETILVYARQEATGMDTGDLVGTAWRLVSLDGIEPIAGSSITLVFQDGQRISGHAGCRDYVVAYEAQDGDLALFYTAMLGAVCAEDALLEQEGAYTTSLGWTTHFRLGEGKLELLTSRGEVLLFEPLVGEITMEGPPWSLLAFIEPNPPEGMPPPLPMPAEVLEGTEIIIRFDGDRLQGSAGCNSYEAAYARDGSTLTMEGIAVTEMACLSPEGVMEQESRYLSLLRDLSAYHVYGGRLWVETGDGRALVFSVQAQPPIVALQSMAAS